MYRVPDNEDIYDYYESEKSRYKRLHRRDEYDEIRVEELPFYQNSSHKEEYED
jgi:hypothetical protein